MVCKPIVLVLVLAALCVSGISIERQRGRRVTQAPNAGTKNVYMTNINYHTGTPANNNRAPASVPTAATSTSVPSSTGAAPATASRPAVTTTTTTTTAPPAPVTKPAPLQQLSAPQVQQQPIQSQPQPPQIPQPLSLPRNSACPDTGPCSMAPATIVDHLTGHTPFVKSVTAISHGDEALLAALANDPVSRKIAQQMNDMRGRIASNSMWVAEVKKITDYYQKAAKAVISNVNDAKRAYSSMQRIIEQRLRLAKQNMLDRKMRIIQEAATKSREKAQGLREESNLIREKLSRPLSPQVIEQLMLAPRLNDQQLQQLGQQKMLQEQREDTQAILNNCNSAAAVGKPC